MPTYKHYLFNDVVQYKNIEYKVTIENSKPHAITVNGKLITYGSFKSLDQLKLLLTEAIDKYNNDDKDLKDIKEWDRKL